MHRSYPLLLLLLLSFFFVNAQSKRSDFKIAASALPLLGEHTELYSSFHGIVIKPSIGFFITDDVSFECYYGYAYRGNITLGGAESYFRSHTIVPTLRANLVNDPRFRLFVEAGYGFGSIKYQAVKRRLNNSEHEAFSGGMSVSNIGVGAAYYFKDRLGVELLVPYIVSKNISTDGEIGYNGLGPTCGISYTLLRN